MSHNPSDGSAYLEVCWEKQDFVPPPSFRMFSTRSRTSHCASTLAPGTWYIIFSGNEHQNIDTQVGKLGKTQREEKRKQRRQNIF